MSSAALPGAATSPSRPPRPPLLSAAGRLLRAREISIALVVLVVFGATSLYNPAFADAASVAQLLAGASIIALLAVGETLVVITRNVDLSVGSVLGLSAYLVGDVFLHNPHFPVPLSFLVALGIGLACGVVNGVIVTYRRVPSLVVTLGTLYAIRGIDAIIVGGTQVNSYSIPSSFIAVGSDTVPGISFLPWLFVIAAAVVLVVNYVLRSFRASRELYAIGSNPEAAGLAGVPIRRRVFVAFAVSGAIAGLAGALWLSVFATVASTAGTGYELTVVAAVVVGGVAIFGGSGTVVGAALGALLLNTITQALVAARISAFWNEAIAGALLLGAIAFDRAVYLRRERALRIKRAAYATA